MSDVKNTDYDKDADMDDIAKLIRYAGERTSVSEERLTAARERVTGHWQDVVNARRSRRRQRVIRQFAVAASLVAALGAVLFVWQGSSPVPAESMIVVNRVIGAASVDGTRLQSGDVVRPGAEIRTSDTGMLALELADGQSLRLDNGTQILVSDASRYRLDRGAVYVDSGTAADKAPVFVETRFGVATDIGTQFQVRVDDSGLQVGVREGLVELSRSGARTVPVNSGTLFLYSSSGEESDVRIDSDDPLWNWVDTIAPAFDIEGASLESYLSWYAQQRAVDLQWENSVSRENARKIRLTGSIEDTSLQEGFEIVRRIAPFDYRLTEAVLLVSIQ